ncbi:MAG: hypothetical protein AB7K86_20135 [Rhodospirillales bacterium]
MADGRRKARSRGGHGWAAVRGPSPAPPAAGLRHRTGDRFGPRMPPQDRIADTVAHLARVLVAGLTAAALALAVASLAPAPGATAATALPFTIEIPRLPPSLQARWADLAVLDVATGRVRAIGGFVDIGRDDLVAALARHPQADARLAGAPLLDRSSDATGAVVCDCGAHLRPGEYLVSERPILEAGTGRFVSINDEGYKAILELMNYPLERSDRLAAAAFSELVYVDNGDAVRRFLDARGFEARLLYGFLNGDAYPGDGDVQFAVIGRRAAERAYVAIRGTSGTGDIKTSLRADLMPWAGRGRVHEGFGATFAVIRRSIEPLMDALSHVPDGAVLTGHSLGGAAAVLLAARLHEEGSRVRVMTFAAPPMGDAAFAAAYGPLGQALHHYVLPGEELEQLQASSPFVWLHRIGTVETLPNVGRTDGTVHYLINYLRAVLQAEGGDRARYERELPVCVLERLPCFAGGHLRRVPICAVSSWDCFSDHANEILIDGVDADSKSPDGLQALRARVDRRRPLGTSGRDAGGERDNRRRAIAAVVESKETLLSERPSPRLAALVQLRIAHAAFVAGRHDEAVRQLREIADRWHPAPVIDYLLAEFETARGGKAAAAAAIAAARAADPPPDFAARLAVLARAADGP